MANTKPRKGSTVWLMIIQTSVNLHHMADHMNPHYIRGDTYFAAAIKHVTVFGGISPRDIAEGLQIGESQVRQWAEGRVYEGHPTREFRKSVLLWLGEAIHKRADDLLDEISRPPRQSPA